VACSKNFHGGGSFSGIWWSFVKMHFVSRNAFSLMLLFTAYLKQRGLLQCFVTFFGFVHPLHRLLRSHSPCCRPVGRFQYLVGHNAFLGGHDFCFHYIFKTNFSGHNKIWGEQNKFTGALAPNASPCLRACPVVNVWPMWQ